MDANVFWRRIFASKGLTYLSYTLSAIFVVLLVILQFTESPVTLNDCPKNVLQPPACPISENEVAQYIRVHDQLAHEYEIIVDKYALLRKEYDALFDEVSTLRNAVVLHHDDTSAQLSAQIASVTAAKAEVLASNADLISQQQGVNQTLSLYLTSLSEVAKHVSELQRTLTSTNVAVTELQSTNPANSEVHQLISDAVRQVKSEIYRLDVLSLVSHQIQSQYKDIIATQVESMIQSLHHPAINTEDIRAIVQQIWREMPSSSSPKSSVIVSEPASPDFALLGAGASILSQYTTDTYRPQEVPPLQWDVYNSLGIETGVGRPEEILSHRMDVGRCWAMAGSSGTIGIRLFGDVNISAISIAHVPRFEAVDITTALRDFEVFGLQRDTGEYTLLVRGMYNIDEPRNTQLFYVPISDMVFSAVVLKVLNNHGHEGYTCVYKVGVHGELAH